MKAAPFKYVLADSIEHALECLHEHGMDVKVIAGGQSLVPMMSMRLARPSVLLDINRLPELQQIKQHSDSVLVGATTRQRTVEDDAQLHATLPLVHDALLWVGHIQTRNRGTVGGSLVHADPTAELPLAAVVMNATLRVRSQAGGERSIAAQDFFLGPMFTAINDTECLISTEWPIWDGTGITTAFDEISMRYGDFAIASAACQLQTNIEGVCQRAAIGLGGVDGAPLAFPEVAQLLVGQRIDTQLIEDVAHTVTQQIEPGSDLYASVEYRRHLAKVLVTRVLRKANSPPNE